MIFNFLKNEKSWFPWVVYYCLFSIGCYVFLYTLGFDTTNYNVIHSTTIFINLLFLYLLLEYFYWNDLKNSFKVKINLKIISKVFTFAILGVVIYLSSELLYDRFVLYFDIKTLDSAMTPSLKPLYLILSLVVAPIFEEVFCRGPFYDSAKENLNEVYAVIFSTFVFMILHMTLYHFIVGFFIGLYLGYLRYHTGGLALPIITHIAINGFNILSMYLIRYVKVSPDVFSEAVFMVSLAFLFIFHFLAFSNYFRKK